MNAVTQRRILIKIGGRAFAADTAFAQLAKAMMTTGNNCEFIIVHGGGAEISAALKANGRPTPFVHRVRVTEKADMAIIEKVLSETVNQRIATALIQGGCQCQRMSGKTGGLLEIHPLPARKGQSLGYVGQVEAVNPATINAALATGKTPVISPVGADNSGQRYNINADHVAAALAVGCKCQDLIFFTDVEGVLVDGQRLVRLNVGQARQLIDNGDITGGMVAKLESAFEALSGGVECVHIAQWQGQLGPLLSAAESPGTRITLPPKL